MGAHRRRRRLFVPLALLAVLTLGSVVLVGVAGADQAPPEPLVPVAPPRAECPDGFALTEQASPEGPGGGLTLSTAEIRRVRVGRHDPCYDRLVFDIVGDPGGFRVRYVDEVTSDPRGEVLTVPGQARLLIVIGNPFRLGVSTGGSLVRRNLARFAEFRSVIFAGSFESVTSVGLGLAEPRPFRVFVLPPGPGHPNVSMIVVDVQHP